MKREKKINNYYRSILVGDGNGVTVNICVEDDVIVDVKIEGIDNALEGSIIAALVALCSDAVHG